MLNVSLIIPTGNRSGSLQRLLNSVDVLVIPPNLVANFLRYGLNRIAGKSQKAYKTEGRIMKCCGYLMGKLRGVRDLDRHSQV